MSDQLIKKKSPQKRVRRRKQPNANAVGSLAQKVKELQQAFLAKHGHMDTERVLERYSPEIESVEALRPSTRSGKKRFNSILNAFDRQKKPGLTNEDIRSQYMSLCKLYSLEGIPVPSYRTYREAILLDDFGTVARFIQPVAGALASRFGDWLIEKAPSAFDWALDKIGSIFGSRTDALRENNSGNTNSTALVPYQNLVSPNRLVTSGYSYGSNKYVSNNTLSSYSVDAVAIHGVQSWLNPESFLERLPDLYSADSCGCTRAVTELILTTDANGNVGFYNAVHGLAANAVATNWYCLTTLNYSAQPFVPSTGVYASTTLGGCAVTAGPAGSSAIPRDFKLIGTVLEFIPITSNLNNQGQLEVIQFKTALNLSYSTTSLPYTPQTNMPNMAYYSINSIKEPRCAVWIPGEPADAEYILSTATDSLGSAPYHDGFYALVTGAPASTAVYRLKITATFSYHPSDSNSLWVEQRNPMPGAATRTFQCSLSQIIPTLFCMPTCERERLSLELGSAEPNMPSLIQVASGFSSKTMSRNLQGIGLAVGQPESFLNSSDIFAAA